MICNIFKNPNACVGVFCGQAFNNWKFIIRRI